MKRPPAIAPGHWETESGQSIAIEYALKQRADLAHGPMSDFELANRQFMAGRFDTDLVAWQTAAKERICWLSVKLAQTLAEIDSLSVKLDQARAELKRPS